jgi:hypothetical protein
MSESRVENTSRFTLTLTERQAELLKEMLDNSAIKGQNYEVFNFRKTLSNALESQLVVKRG